MTDTLAPEQTEYRPDDAPAGEPLRAPFPAFGGKSRAVGIVWPRFGRVVNYVEPFAFSAAMLLGMPFGPLDRPRVETINDVNGFVSNFWRAVKGDPETVASIADYPVIETDLHSRHRWLLAQAAGLREKLDADPDYFDPKIAAFWVWGASAWIGSGWCEEGAGPVIQAPHLGGGQTVDVPRENYGKGIHAAGMRAPSARLPDLGGGTQWGTDEANARAGKGVHREAMRGPSEQIPALGGGGASNAGLNGVGMRRPSEKLPDLGAGHDSCGYGQLGRGVHAGTARTRLYDLFAELSARLRYTRVACGDFARILTPSVTYRHGLTAVFLDPPYDGHEYVYGAAGKGEPISARVRAWCVENGQRDDLRIALCGYEGEHDALEALGWEVVAWAAKGGYGNQGSGDNENKRRERIWFSPACLKPGQATPPAKPAKRGKPANAAQTSLFDIPPRA